MQMTIWATSVKEISPHDLAEVLSRGRAGMILLSTRGDSCYLHPARAKRS